MVGWRAPYLETALPVPFGHYVITTDLLRTCSWCGRPVWLLTATHVTFCEVCDHLRARESR